MIRRLSVGTFVGRKIRIPDRGEPFLASTAKPEPKHDERPDRPIVGARLTPPAVVRFSIFVVLGAIVASLSFRFFFPGYFDPFAIYHIDHYLYQGMSAYHSPLTRYFALYPRPVGYLIIDLCGRLGPRGVLFPIFLFSIFNAALLCLYIERITGRKIAFWCFLFFAALAYANPQLYFHLKADPFATFSLTFLLLAFHFWQAYVETGKSLTLAATLLFIALFALTKESYFGLLALFFIIQFFIAPKRRVAAATLLVLSCAAMSYSIHRASQVWTLLHSQTNDPYYSDMSPAAVTHGFIRIGKHVFFPMLDLAIIAVLALIWRRSRKLFLVALTCVVFAVVSLLPNATLPNHLEPQYAGLAVYLFLAPLLLVDRGLPRRSNACIGLALCGLTVYGIALWEYGRSVAYSDAWWLRIQEQKSRHIVASLEHMRNNVKPQEASLVTGIDSPFNPFNASAFVLGYMGPNRYWTVVVPDHVAESAEDTTRLIHATNPDRLQTYDHWFVFNADGSLAKELEHPAPAMIAPELSPSELQAQAAEATQMPALGKLSFYAVPNPVTFGPDGRAVTTIFWLAPVPNVQVRIGTPGGVLFAEGQSVGTATTGNWVKPGMVFYLQDASGGDPTSPNHTLRRLEITDLPTKPN